MTFSFVRRQTFLCAASRMSRVFISPLSRAAMSTTCGAGGKQVQWVGVGKGRWRRPLGAGEDRLQGFQDPTTRLGGVWQ